MELVENVECSEQPVQPYKPYTSKSGGPIRGLIVKSLLRLADVPVLGRKRLAGHIVACGFPRSGSTLLYLVLNACIDDALVFSSEKSALNAAKTLARRWSYIISKRPNDIFRIDMIRALYSGRRPFVRFILTVRDPRAVLTSRHSRWDRYYVTPERWRAIYEMYQRYKDADDAITMKFEDLVTDLNSTEISLSKFIGWKVKHPFNEYFDHVPPDFKTIALNGLRSLDPSTISKWKDPANHERLREMVRTLPELPQAVIDLGYEQDDAWLKTLV